LQLSNEESINNDYKKLTDKQREYNKKVTKLNINLTDQLEKSKQKEKYMFKFGVGIGVTLILVPEIIV